LIGDLLSWPIEEARKSVAEDDRPHPRVGAVVVKDGEVLSRAHRGEKPKSHAEFVALEDKLPDGVVTGSTVYTTLEPCTTRTHPKIPCAQRLIDRKVKRVVIGMLDPNPDIMGRGDQMLSDAGIEVQLFSRELRAQVEELNREFIRAQKRRQTTPTKPQPGLEADSQEYWEQRKKAPETELLKKIRQRPGWRIWIRPSHFKPARFQNVEQCRQFVLSSEVLSSRRHYPTFFPKDIELGGDWVACESEYSGAQMYHAERWMLYRSAQFVQNRTFDEIAQLGGKVHALQILDVTTAAVEFAARMLDRRVLMPNGVLTFELRGVAGRNLTWPKDMWGDVDDVPRGSWSQDETITVERQVPSDRLRSQGREIAREISAEIYEKFGWTQVPIDKLVAAQNQRFGEK
jgi:pyrimidine deaminase RibD-like protein